MLAACFDALFVLAREATAKLAIELLDREGPIAEAAAIALGSARIETATEALAAWCIGAPPERRHRVGYVALALLRADAANELLLERITKGGATGSPPRRRSRHQRRRADRRAHASCTRDADVTTRREIDDCSTVESRCGCVSRCSHVARRAPRCHRVQAGGVTPPAELCAKATASTRSARSKMLQRRSGTSSSIAGAASAVR